MAYRLDVRFTVTAEEFDPTSPEPVTDTLVRDPVPDEPEVEEKAQQEPEHIEAGEPGKVFDGFFPPEQEDGEDEKVPVHQGPELTKYHFPVKDKQGIWYLPAKKFAEYKTIYRGIDVIQELRKAKLWLSENATRQKTARGMGKFLINWLNRAEAQPQMATREEFLDI